MPVRQDVLLAILVAERQDCLGFLRIVDHFRLRARLHVALEVERDARVGVRHIQRLEGHLGGAALAEAAAREDDQEKEKRRPIRQG